MSRAYVVPAYRFFLRDGGDPHERLLFHVRAGDYFLMLAGALAFVEEALAHASPNGDCTLELAFVRRTRADLRYLHERYHLAPNASFRSLS